MAVISLYIQEVILHDDGVKVPRAADFHNYRIRHAAGYNLPAHYLFPLCQKKPSYAGQKLFNLLPAEMKILTRKNLKKSLNEWLTSRLFYTLEEYLHREDLKKETLRDSESAIFIVSSVHCLVPVQVATTVTNRQAGRAARLEVLGTRRGLVTSRGEE
ncbi:hypothetical protein J6590_012012 [Homalodisca vitripennis]|nr:hypothetical protein J6590_012012 [Homalodisca vitripennis]